MARILQKVFALVSVLLLPYHSLAAGLSCPRMTHDESIERYLGLTQVMGDPQSRYSIEADVFNRLGYAPFDPVNNDDRLKIIHGFLGLIEEEIFQAALKSTIETFYFVYEPTAIENSLLRTKTRSLASRAVYYLCQMGCKVGDRRTLTAKAQAIVDELVAKNQPRYTVNEITEQLNINFQGLNSILDYRTSDGNIDLASYQHHYQVLRSSFPGFLINIPRIEGYYGKAFTLDDYQLNGRVFTNPRHKTDLAAYKVRNALREHFDNLRHKWSTFNHQSLFKFKWFDYINIYSILDTMSNQSKHIPPTPFEERLLLLSKYLASSPLAVANVLKKNPEYLTHLCWMIENMDRATSSWYITSSVSGLDHYLMPLTIGVLIFAGPFVPGIWMAGLIVLNIVTAIDLMRRNHDTNKLRSETRLHTRVEGTELETYQTQLIIDSQETQVRKAKWMSGAILAMEVASLGAIRGFSVYARRVAESLSEAQQINRLMRPYLLRQVRHTGKRRDHRLMFARVETTRFIDMVKRKKPRAYDRFVEDYYQRNLSQIDYDLMDLTFAIKHGKKKDVMKLLLSSKTTGFGMTGFNIELGAEAIEQVIIHLNTPVMTDFTSVEILLRAVMGDY